jgi:ankyrin repeat protein
MCGNEAVVEVLLDDGFNPNINTPQMGAPLHSACMYRLDVAYKIIKMLINAGADVNLVSAK